MKTAHEASAGRHTVRYGANARHVSDMADMDENYFVLLGGQDGWINSSTMLDQWPSWRSGEYVRVPLSLDSVRKAFTHTLCCRKVTIEAIVTGVRPGDCEVH